MISWRRRRQIVAAVAVVVGVVHVGFAAVVAPTLRVDEFRVHLGRSGDVASRYVLLVSAVLLLSSVRGLLRGNRLAWDVAAVATGLGFVSTQARDADGPAVLGGVAMIVALALSWSACTGRSQEPTVRHGVEFFAIGMAGAYLFGVVGLYLMDARFSRSTTLLGSMVDAAGLLVWVVPSDLGRPRLGEYLIVDSVRFVVLIVVVITAVLLVRAARTTRASSRDRADAQSILERHGRNGLAYFNLLDDKLYCFDADRSGFLSYKVIGNVAVALGDPVAPCERAGDVLDAFLAMCLRDGLEPCIHQASDAVGDLYEERGLIVITIGEEAIIDLAEFSLDQPGMKTVRKKSNKLRRDGVVVEELPAPIDAATMAELRELSDAWLVTGGHRERSFTLGWFDAAYLRDTKVLVARSPGTGGAPGRLEAFVNLVPVYRGVNGNFDLMRRRPDAPASVMDLLFVSMIERFRDEGLRGMNLGLAPLAGITGTTPADRVAHTLYERADRFFNFQGLHDFKDKWNPRWEQRFLVARSNAALAKVVAAVSTAGEYDDPVTRHPYLPATRGAVSLRDRVADAIASVQRRSDLWLFGVLVGVVVAIQAWTVGHPGRFRRLHAALSVSWNDVRHLRLARILTSSLIQTVPGMVWSIVVFAVLAVVGAVWRIGGRRAVLVWFVADPLATVVLFTSTQVLVWLGIASVDGYLVESDSGSSSALLAVITATVLSFSGRTRNVMFSVLVISQIAFLVATGKSAYVHHLITITITVGVVALLDRRNARSRRPAGRSEC